MDNFRVAFTRFLAFYSDNPSGLRHGETLAKWPSKASFALHPEDGGTFTVRHDFVGFVEPRESGIRNPEFVTLSYVTCWRLLYSFILFQLGEAQFALQYSSLTSQDIEQNVSETLADQGIKEPLSNVLLLF